jgi:acyl-CoA-binding protein
MSDEIAMTFQQAKDDVTKLSNAPGNDVMLRLYALFKQATKGDCTGDRPGMMDFVGRAKYDAWKTVEGITKDEAKRQYVALVEELKRADR